MNKGKSEQTTSENPVRHHPRPACWAGVMAFQSRAKTPTGRSEVPGFECGVFVRKRISPGTPEEEFRNLVQVVHFQLGRVDPPGVVSVPSIRPDLSGRFTTEVGVCIEDVDQPLGQSKFLSAWDCELRFSPSELSEKYPDHWWKNDVESSPDLVEFVERDIFPMLEKLETVALVMEHWPKIAPCLRAGTGVPWRYLLSRIHLSQGDNDLAQQWFDRHWKDLRERWPESRAFRGLAAWAEQHNLRTSRD